MDFGVYSRQIKMRGFNLTASEYNKPLCPHSSLLRPSFHQPLPTLTDACSNSSMPVAVI
jgi:hypothetical protein